MKKIFNFISVSLIFFPLILFLMYLGYLFILPDVLNSVRVNSYVERILLEKTGLELKTNNLKFKSNKNLSANVIADKIQIYRDEKKVLDVNGINIKFIPVVNDILNVTADYIYIDKGGFTNLLSKKSNNKNKIKINSLPDLHIQRAEILLTSDKENITLITLDNIFSNKDAAGLYSLSYYADIQSALLKNNIVINSDRNIKFDDKNLFIENLQIKDGVSTLFINGNIKSSNEYEIFLNGKNLPVRDIESSLLYSLKLKNPKKNFLENFYDYSGNADIDIKISSSGVDGTVLMKGLCAKTVLFDVPVNFKDFTGYFDGDEIRAEAYGKLGFEDVYTNFYLSHYDKERRVIYGRVHSVLTNKSFEKYMPDFALNGGIDAALTYRIEKSLPKISYLIKLNKGSNLKYKTVNLGLIDKNRRVFVKTTKYPDKLNIDSYEYALQDGSSIDKIVTGNALFEKINGKMQPVWVTCKTEKPAPVSVVGSFGKRLKEGTFEGDLKYDFLKNLLTGHFNLSDSRYNNFEISGADIKADEKTMVISSTGTYLGSDYKCYLDVDNNFTDIIKINNIDLFLDKYKIVKQNRPNKTDIKNSKIAKKAKQLDYIIEKGSIRLNKLLYKKIIIENAAISGDLHENIFNFTTDTAYFAKGTLKANGIYDIKKQQAVIDFSADNIDSNSVAAMVFNLPDEIEGIAKAKLHAKIDVKTHGINANANFAIKQGYLPKIGSTEFIIKKSKLRKTPLKIKISDIVNIDISKSKAMASDINGTFNMKDWQLKDINLFSKQKYLSLFVEGNYDIDKENADLKLWGKYNKTARNKVKILFVPLSVIMKVIFKEERTMHLYADKIKKIPSIQAQDAEIEVFSVKMTGNLNNNDVKVELKSIK